MFSVDWANRIVDASGSITDIPSAHVELRQLEMSAAGVLYPPIITYKELALGGGAKFPAIEFINGYRLRFPAAGTYLIAGGNLSATILPVAGVFVERTSSAAYAVTTVGAEGGGGAIAPTTTEVAAAVWSHPFAATLLTLKKFLGNK